MICTDSLVSMNVGYNNTAQCPHVECGAICKFCILNMQ